ncbi:MAG: MFS transporter [Acidobacteria bacterium]|nr:MFS transporter [Acidobacteriota bacterium]
MITYIDRACISTAKDPIAADLSLSDAQMGVVFSAFALGYAAAQVPGGWIADRFGPRRALAGVVILWSVFTALTGFARSFAGLVAIRFLFGVGEAGAFPGCARAFYNWLPVAERGRANGIIFSGARIGAAFSFPLLAWMLGSWGWRSSFLVLGAIGVAWAIWWWLWFRDHPPKPVEQPAAERSDLSFRDVFRSRGMLLNMVQYFAGNFTFFICLSWMLPYLKQHYSLSTAEAARYSMAPLLFGATAQWSAGYVVDRLYRAEWRAWSRRLPAMAGFALAAAGLIALTRADSVATAVAFFTLATFGAEMTISPSWAYCVDVGGKNSGAISGSMNMIGNFGSFVSANAFPLLYGATGTASTYFVAAAVLNVISIGCWVAMRSLGRGAPRAGQPGNC